MLGGEKQMALQTLRTITNTATVTYQYTPSAGGPPISRTIEDTAINLLVIPPKPSRTFATSFTHNNSMCFDVPDECRNIGRISHTAQILSYKPVYDYNCISLNLDILEHFSVEYFSSQKNGWCQTECSDSVNVSLKLPDFIQPSQIKAITASTINTQTTSLTPCQLNITSTIQYVILYDPNSTSQNFL